MIYHFSSFAQNEWQNESSIYSVHTFNIIPKDKRHCHSGDSVPKLNKISFAIKPGLNLSRMNFNKGFPQNDYPYKQKWRTGLTLGAFMDFPLNNKWAIIQEYNFSNIRGDYIPYEASINLYYLSIPLFMRYSLSSRFHLISGFQFDLLISGKQMIDGVTEIITKSTEERNVGLNIGLHYYISRKIFIEARVMHGINSIGLWQRGGIKEFKLETLVISGGYFLYKKPLSK